LVGGAAFAFSFYRFDHLPHMTLLSNEWLPFILLCAYKLLWTGSWRWAAALGVFFTLQALSSHYLAFYSVMLLGLFVLYYGTLLVRKYGLRGKSKTGPQGSKIALLPFVGKLGLAVFVGVMAMLPVIIPYVQVQDTHE